MSDYMTRLEASLRQAAAREYAKENELAAAWSVGARARRGRSWWWVSSRLRRSPLALVAVVVLAGGSAAAAVALLSMRSAALTGTVPGLGRLRYDIPLTPDLEPGHAGWCSYPLFSITGSIDDAGAGTCSPAAAPGAGVILGGGEPVSNEQALLRQSGHALHGADRHLSLVWMVVSSRVAAVRIGGRQVITPRADPRLPSGWRAVVAFTSMPLGQIRPVALDARGNPIPASGAVPGQLVGASGGVSPSRSYVPGSHEPAPCVVAKVRLAGVIGQWEVVATRTPARGAAVADGTLLSCARSWFSISGHPDAPSAAFLLNARAPRRRAPAPPGLTPTNQPGVFTVPSAEILAKRVGVGWLIVQSRSLTLAWKLLDAIRVDGTAVMPDTSH